MKKVLYCVLLIFVLLPATIVAQSRKEMTTPAMNRAMEALGNSDVSEMLRYLNIEIGNNPKNGYAYVWMAEAYYSQKETGYALQSVEKAIKYLPSRDKDYMAYAYKVRGDIYLNLLEEPQKALKDYTKAIDYTPKEPQVYIDRAELYFKQKEYELSDKDYKKVTNLDPSNVLGYMGLGRNAKEQGNYKLAIEQYNYVIKLQGTNYSSSYSFRAESYIALGKFSEAADDIVTALSIDSDTKAWLLMYTLADSSYFTITTRIKVQKNLNPNDPFWPYVLGIINQHCKKYTKAIANYKEAYSMKITEPPLSRISECLSEMGDYQHALDYINQALAEDSTNLISILQRVEINYALGNSKAVMDDLNNCLKEYPQEYELYSSRGWYNLCLGNEEAALEDYTTIITLGMGSASDYFYRGKILCNLGDKYAAKKDFQKSIELDTIMSNLSAVQYAYLYLGDTQMAQNMMDTTLKYQPIEGLYNAACLYSLIGNKEVALDYLKKALNNGYRNFEHINRDSDFNNIRNTKEFIDLIAKYKAQQKDANAKNEETLGKIVEHQVLVPFERRNGVTEIQCKINDLPLYFVFDTGAGDVTISVVEATFMLKNGYLSNKDILGKQNYMTATGEISEGTLINLHTVEINGLKLNNVRASVVKSQNAPLLLGQSVLSRLGTIEIDNANRVLKITYSEIK